MSDFITLIKDNKEAVGFIVAVSGGIGFFLNYFLARKKIKEDKKAIRQQMITNNIAPMRQAWISEVRVKISEFISTSNFARIYMHDLKSDDKLFSNENERHRLIVEHCSKSVMALCSLKLLLPVNEDDYSLLVDDLTKINENVNTNSLSDEERKNLVNKIINQSRKLLKKEWEVTKSLNEIE
ncbi:hypothetical protein RI835_004137 [Providencia rettgeri]|nr:hypothetical protein [Providencia rettgeri]